MRRRKRAVQLMHHRGFADAGLANHQEPFLTRRSATTRSNADSNAPTSRSLPYSFSGIMSLSGTSRSPSPKGSIRPWRFPLGETAPQIVLDAGGGLVTLLRRLGQ